MNKKSVKRIISLGIIALIVICAVIQTPEILKTVMYLIIIVIMGKVVIELLKVKDKKATSYDKIPTEAVFVAVVVVAILFIKFLVPILTPFSVIGGIILGIFLCYRIIKNTKKEIKDESKDNIDNNIIEFKDPTK